MQVRCPQCLNPQTLEIRLAAGDTKRVNCSECNAVFSVRAKSASSSAFERSDNSGSKAGVEQPSAETPHWQVRKSDGTVLQFPNLSLFQSWQAQGIISVGDEISRNGHQWRAISDIPELIGLFDKEVSKHPVQSNATPATPPPLPSDADSEPQPTAAMPAEDTQAPQPVLEQEQEAESTAPETTQPIDESSKGEQSENPYPEPAEDSDDAVDNALSADPEAAAATGAPPPMTFEASAAELSLDPSRPRSDPGDAPVIKREENLVKEPGEDSSASDLSDILKQAQELPIARTEAPLSRKGGSRWLTVALILMLVATMSASAYVVWQRNMDPPEQESQIFGEPSLTDAAAEDVPTTESTDRKAVAEENTPEATQKVEAETQETADSAKPEEEEKPSAPPPDIDKPAEEKTAPTTTDKPAEEKIASKDIPSDDEPASPVARPSAVDTDDMETMPDDDEPEEPPAAPAEPPPSDPATYRGLMSASKVALKKKPSRALMYARKAMERNPRSVAPIARMGWAYLRMGDTTNAIIQFDKARNMNPGFRDTYRGLGQSYEQAGRKTDAITAYERYLAMCGDCSRAKKILTRLDGLQRTH
jgi:hypothetical protein